MNDYTRVQNAIEFIENRLHEDVDMKEIAAQACFSAFHFQRLFHLITGFTVHEYIRKRRLSEAAKVVKETNGSLLDIALSCRYGSHEAFTRSFAGFFGVTPAEYRKNDYRLNMQNKVDFRDYSGRANEETKLRKPDLVRLEPMKIVGHEYKTSLNNGSYFADIPGFYDHFGVNGYYERITDRAKPDFPYGIGAYYEDNGDFSFIIGEEVHSFGNRETGFVHFEIPGGTYAEFKANGAPEFNQSLWRYIYGTWLPNSNYERREGPDFEVTDVRHSVPGCLAMKIYIPIQ
ncbi:effector binding domain-containing protein [Cohnella faecalis]|uniref:AraC family transcriptional regulator n=1 Tax=Cohnella faecalis TaxID=2315694 RepID=A0A398CEK6_9BACL|nr:AraC family transcriptional regulator [Cohnella faecalis]RIE01143.1 AraC family transcriptional regulator [Cohnella faecalis]